MPHLKIGLRVHSYVFPVLICSSVLKATRGKREPFVDSKRTRTEFTDGRPDVAFVAVRHSCPYEKTPKNFGQSKASKGVCQPKACGDLMSSR